MAYYGNQPIAGETNSFKVLDDISSYTKTFDGSSAAVVSTSDDTLTFYDHRFIQGQRVTYGKGGGTVITGLTDATVYYVIRQDKDTIKLATSASNAAALTAVNLTGVGAGASHTLNVAFDGTNTKFKATTGSGTHIKLTRPGQLMIAMNGVVQEPQNNTPSNGFGIEGNNVIVFSTAPTVLDTFWGHYLTSNLSSWELSDNKIDNFTGDGSTTTFTLSKTPANAENILVTVDGVTQYPSESGTARAYTLSASVVTFTAAPALNAAIAVRHIGYAGGSGSGGVSGFYGRTGNVQLIRSDLQNTDINLKNLTGVAATFTGNVSIGGTLTYTDVTNIDSIGIVTAQNGINVLANGINVQAGVATFAAAIDANGGANIAGGLDLGDTLYWDGDTLTTIDNAGISSTFRFKTGGTTVMDITATKNVNIKDDRQLLIGNSNDLTIYHSSSTDKSYVTSSTHDVIHAFNVGKPWTLQTTAADKRIHCPTTKSVELYHNGTKKFETDKHGAIVSGVCTATSFSGSGANLTSLPTQVTITGNSDNRIITGGSGVNLNGESNFTYDGDEVAIYAQTDDTDCILHLVGKTPNGGVGQAGRTAIIAESTATSNGSSSMHLRTRNSSNSQLIAMTLDSNQRVGVGTQLPGSLVEIYNPSTAGNTVLHVHNDKTGDAAQIRLEGGRTSSNDYGQVLFANSGNNNALILAEGSADQGSLLFKTSDTGSGDSMSTYLQIAANGNIKLGNNAQNAPGARLHVEDSNNTDYDKDATTGAVSEYFVNTGTGDCTGILLQNTSTNATNTCQATIHSIAEGTNKNTSLTFGTRQNSDATIRERVRIQSTGQILYSAASGDNTITSKRTNTASSNGNYFFFLKASDENDNNVGSLGFIRDSAVDDSRFVLMTRSAGGSNLERLRVHSTGGIRLFRAADNYEAIDILHNADAGNGTTAITPVTRPGSGIAAQYLYLKNAGSGSGSTSMNLIVDGALSKGSGSFRIPHPLESLKDTKLLYHSFIEGPQCDNIYRGKVTLSSGTATVNIDTVSNMTVGTFVALNRDIQCFTSNETGWDAVKGSVSGNILTITSQNNSSTDTISWMVVGERQDPNIKESELTDDNGHLIVEGDKGGS